jgi:transcriptional regulator with XRE-family HTH domain
MMNRHEQRRRKFLQDPEVAEGYREMEAEFQFMQAIEAIRLKQRITKEDLAAQMGKKRETVSRLLTTQHPNPTLETVIELLSALRLTADITFRRAKEGDPPLRIATEPNLTSEEMYTE